MAAMTIAAVLMRANPPHTESIPDLARLTRKERQLLEMLIHNAGRSVSRETLLTHVWGYGDGVKSRTVDVHVQRLRRKLPPEAANSIKTIVRAGYCWMPEPTAS